MSIFNIDTCKWVLWGAKVPYNTYGHIHDAILRALKFLGKDAVWLDRDDDISQIDFSNTLFMSMNCVIGGMPLRKDCFYVVHNAAELKEPFFKEVKLLAFGQHISTNTYSPHVLELGPEIFFDPESRVLHFRWGTDLLPHEIGANKPNNVFKSDSRVVNYVGTVDDSNRGLLARFAHACIVNGVAFRHFGGIGYQDGPVVSIEQNVRLIQESYMAPTIQNIFQVDSGQVVCRLFKNISYGQFGITNSKFANDLFGGKLIYNPDTYQLFYDALEKFQSMTKTEKLKETLQKELWELMDEVARKHTYLNKIDGIIRAVRTLEGGSNA